MAQVTEPSEAGGHLTVGRVREALLEHDSILTLIALGIALVLWELVAASQPDYLFPTIGGLFDAYIEQVESYGLVEAYLRTLSTIFIGFFIAAAAGIPLGLLTGLDRRASAMLNPYINGAYVAPISALIPVIILIGGASIAGRIFVVFLFAFFEITINTQVGVQTTPPELSEVARSFGASRFEGVRMVDFPNAVPYVFAGLRLGLGRATRGVILAELLIEFTNLGAIIRLWQDEFRVAGIFTVVILLMATGILLTWTMKRLGNRLFPWREEGG